MTKEEINRRRLGECEFVVRRYYTDRLFSQLMRHLYSLFIAKKIGKQHLHWAFDQDIETNFRKILNPDIILDVDSGLQHGDIHQKMHDHSYFSLADQDWEKLFSVDWIFDRDNLNTLKQAYRLEAHTPGFLADQGPCRVALHIRRGDVRSYWPSYTDLGFFKSTMDLISSRLRCSFHIYSDSTVQLGDGPDIYYHINEDLLQSAHDMAQADILVLSIGSNFSHFCGMLNEGAVYFDRRKLESRFPTIAHYATFGDWTGQAEKLLDQIGALG